MRADEVVEEDEHGNEVVGRRKGREALFGFVPGLELFVEALNEVVGNVIVETLYADVLYPMERLNRHLIGKVAVAHNGARRAKILYRLQYGESLRTVSVTVEMEAEDKACLTVQNEPEVVFFALYFNDGFIGVPLVRVEIKRRNELYGHVLEQRGKVGTPVTDGRVRHLDIHYSTQNQSDVAKRVLAQIEHTQGH